MKVGMLAALAVVGALGLASSAQAQGLYGKVEAGLTFGGVYDLPGPDVKLDTGWAAGLGIGDNLAPNVRVEGEFDYGRSQFKGGGGRSTAMFGLANAYYDFTTGASFTPFIGAGVGIAKLDNGPDDDTGFAYKLTAGVAKQFSPNLTGELAYRYDAAPNLHLSGTDVDYRENAVTAGLRFRFGP